MDSKIINITGLWINKSKDGAQYLSGNLGMAKVLVFKNKNKRPNSKDPDYNVCMAPNEPKEETAKQDDGDAF
jgi:hypothetical protein